jgi:hypothetical protein
MGESTQIDLVFRFLIELSVQIHTDSLATFKLCIHETGVYTP